jgi:hypothetical protein
MKNCQFVEGFFDSTKIQKTRTKGSLILKFFQESKIDAL